MKSKSVNQSKLKPWVVVVLCTPKPGPLTPPLSPGNGPSGICLSYLLSGYTPYVKPDSTHPHPLLQRKLTEAQGVSILDQVGQSSEQTGPPCGNCPQLSQGKKQR